MDNIEVKIKNKWIPLGELASKIDREVSGHSIGDDGYLTVYTINPDINGKGGKVRFRPMEWREYDLA